MILMHQWPDEPTRTPNDICYYEAETFIEDRRYSARSRRGAPFALARILLAAGITDQPVQVTHKGVCGHMSYRSLHRMAELTVVENATTPVRLGPYREWPSALHGEPENRGEMPSPVLPRLPARLKDEIRRGCGQLCASAGSGGDFYRVPPRDLLRRIDE
jgi:hypothetical protein